MKNIKKISLLLVVIFTFSITLSFNSFAHDDRKPIEDNDKIYANIPWEYEASVFTNSLAYSDEEGNTITYCVGENKFAPDGITKLTPEKAQVVFEYFYLYDGDIEGINECCVEYKTSDTPKVNGYSCYLLTGNYSYSEVDGQCDDFVYSFCSYVFATKENIFVVAYEGVDADVDNMSDLVVAVSGIVFNGTPLNGDKPEHNANHDFSNSPAFEDAVLKTQEETISRVMEEENIVGIFAGVMVAVFIVPTAILFIIAIVLITKYSKNKKLLKRYEMTYGDIPTYNAYQQNYGGYGYNQPYNQPYQQPPVNPVYQNKPQTPSYVTDAINNLEESKPQQPVVAPETQEVQNTESAGE